jgi:glycine/sarcosine N-methyltransferase
MATDETPADFYDELADDYHLIFADWDASIGPQARVITGLLRNTHGLTSGAVLDASYGIGTQALGLARAGFTVTATDVSPASVERCAREAAARGLSITTGVADLRVLDIDGGGRFEVSGWSVTERRTTYRALSRGALSDALQGAGFKDIVWADA